MAEFFIYPKADFYNVEPVGGALSSTNFAEDTDVTNESRLTDQSTSLAADFPANFDTVRFDLGDTDKTIDSIAVYANGSDADDLNFYGSSSATSGLSFISGSNFADTFAEGWNVRADAMSNDTRYVFMRGTGALAIFTEVIIGTKLALTNVNLSGSEGVNYGNETLVSEGGQEFSHQKHGAKKFWHFSLNHVSETYKTNLEAMRDAVDGSHYKFLYYDGSSYNYVRMSTDSLRFKEVAVGVYNTRIKLTEQLS